MLSSIEDVDWQQFPVLWTNPKTKELEIVVGHTRILAAQKMGMKEVPCKIDNTLTPEQVARYRIIDNKSGEKAGWDFEKLQLEMQPLDLTHAVFEANYSPLELDAIMGKVWDEEISSEEPFRDTQQPDIESQKRYTVLLTTDQYLALSAAMALLREDDPTLKDGECVQQIVEEWMGTRQ